MAIKQILLTSAAIAAPIAIFTVGPVWLQFIAAAVAGLTCAGGAALLGSPLLKDDLKHDPDNREKPGMFLEVQKGRSSVIMKGGTPVYVIEGGDNKPQREEAPFWLWWIYQRYIFRFTGLHAYIPFFFKPHTYEVPRYELNAEGAEGYKLLGPKDKKYWSNHVRTEPFIWHFKFENVEIQKMQFTVTGTVGVRIVGDPVKVIAALFDIESWAEVLNEAVKAIVRNYMRSNVTLDDILGVIPEDIWATVEKTSKLDKFAYDIKEALRKYWFTRRDASVDEDGVRKTLLDFGIDIQRVDINDFKAEFDPTKLHDAALGRERGRARHLEGQGIASAEKALLAVHKDGGAASIEILRARGLVDVAKNGGGLLDGLAAAFIKKQQGG